MVREEDDGLVSSVPASRRRPEPRVPDASPDRTGSAEVSREIRPAPPRYRNEIGKFGIHRGPRCAACGRCVETCRHGVHVRPGGYLPVMRPYDYRCIGPGCRETGSCCIDLCPEGALKLTDNPVAETIGDFRWTPDLLLSTWAMAHFTFEEGIVTCALLAACPLRIRVSISAMGSVIIMVHQLALTRPGTSPRMAASRSMFLDSPNLR